MPYAVEDFIVSTCDSLLLRTCYIIVLNVTSKFNKLPSYECRKYGASCK